MAKKKLATKKPEPNNSRSTAAKELDRMLMMAERRDRLELFIEQFDHSKMGSRYFWKKLAYLWTDAEMPSVNHDIWLNFFNASWPIREALMTAEEHKMLAGLPDEFPIFRGIAGNSKKKKGLSWTLERDRAVWFANRFSLVLGEPFVLEATCKKKNVLALFLGRGEKEIVTNPKFLRPKSVPLTAAERRSSAR